MSQKSLVSKHFATKFIPPHSTLLKKRLCLLSLSLFLSSNVMAKPALKPLTRVELENKLAEMIAKVDCAKLNGSITDDAIVNLTGFAGRQAEIEHLVNELQGFGVKVVSTVESRPWPQCDVLLRFNDALLKASDLQVSVAGKNKAVLQRGEPLTIEVITPSYPSYLYVSYVQANGDAIHLTQPEPKEPTPLEPKTKLVLGNGKKGSSLFTIQPPFGDEMIVVVAAKKPLFTLPLPKKQIGREYLSQFQQVFSSRFNAETDEQDISVAVATLITQARP